MDRKQTIAQPVKSSVQRQKVLTKRSFTLSGHRTSVALEPEFWAVLEAMAAEDGAALSALVVRLDAARTPDRPLASCLRVAALTWSKRSSGETAER